ncbi:MAG: xylulokinase, partial [Anaerolineae bacterium]
MADPLLIGIDLGTTNGKVACYDLQGQLQAEAVHSYPTYHPRPGWYEQDPRDWIAALRQGLQEVADHLGPRVEEVAGLAVSSFGPGLVMLDAEGNPLARCPTWQDERSLLQGQRLVKEVGTGWIGPAPPLMGFPAKLLWAIEEMPDLVAHAVWAMGIKDYLLYWLTDQVVTEPSSVAGGVEWYAPVFGFIGWPMERLPRVVASTESPGGLRKDLARQVGLRPGIPVFAGLNDGAAATLGSGAVYPGDSVITLATNGVARLVLEERISPDDLLQRHLFTWPYVAGLWVGGGITYSGAGSLQWLFDQFGLPRDPMIYDTLLAQAAEVPRGSAGVTFLPYLAGRGTPAA